MKWLCAPHTLLRISAVMFVASLLACMAVLLEPAQGWASLRMLQQHNHAAPLLEPGQVPGLMPTEVHLHIEQVQPQPQQVHPAEAVPDRPRLPESQAALLSAWITDTPHLPPPELEPALRAAAFHGSSGGPGLVMLTSGNMHAQSMFLPRWLASLSRTREGDITRHAVVVSLGRRAQDFCASQKRTFGHHCIQDSHWPGPEEPYQFAQDWYVAVTLSKVELILNVLASGHSALWVDTDVVHFVNPLPYMLALDTDIAMSPENCKTRSDFTPAGWNRSEEFNQNTGISMWHARPQVQRFVHDWLSIQRQHLREWVAGVHYDPMDIYQRRSDQVTFNKFAVPAMLQNHPGSKPFVRIQALPLLDFPNWCSHMAANTLDDAPGECGCEGEAPSRGLQPLNKDFVLNELGNLERGSLECPAKAVERWVMYHVPCSGSGREKTAVLDMFQGMADRVNAERRAVSNVTVPSTARKPKSLPRRIGHPLAQAQSSRNL